ncbi:MAG: PDZ domain-containing protein [Armatimonadetes bacterium]|nr:PDZ domain-containing protein [Armatimonadota bacterium]MBS1727883.1 trypsin-like peptidase domain-containing protein [Armatimonadota bacterium]
MKTVRSWAAYAMIVGGFAAGVATVVSMTHGFKADSAFAKGPSYSGKLVGNITTEEAATLHNLNDSLTHLAEYVKPAVVHIRAVTNRASDSDGKMIPISGSEGAGFIYRKDGYVITNDHVVGDADQVTVITNDGREHKGTVKRAPEWDVAVIKIDGSDFPTLGMADSKSVEPGQMVMAIGSPYGLENSVTFGHVSAVNRENAIPDSSLSQAERFYPDLIQTDAAINVGNSGGPLVNIDGQVIGMNSSIYTKTGGSNGIAFAIPSSEVRFVADILIQKGKVVRSQIGVYPRDLKPFELSEKKLPGGAYVEDIQPGGPADKAGIKKGDIITKVNNTAIDGQIDLRNTMLVNAPDTVVKVEFVHDGKTQTADIKLEKAVVVKPTTPKARTYNFDNKDFGDIFGNPDLKDFENKLRQQFGQGDKGGQNDQRDQDDNGDVQPLHSGHAKLGIGIDNLTDANRRKNSIPTSVTGVLVTTVESGSVAEKSGIQVGDVIQSIGGKKVSTIDELTSQMSNLNWGDKTQIGIARYGKGSQMTLERSITFK